MNNIERKKFFKNHMIGFNELFNDQISSKEKNRIPCRFSDQTSTNTTPSPKNSNCGVIPASIDQCKDLFTKNHCLNTTANTEKNIKSKTTSHKTNIPNRLNLENVPLSVKNNSTTGTNSSLHTENVSNKGRLHREKKEYFFFSDKKIIRRNSSFVTVGKENEVSDKEVLQHQEKKNLHYSHHDCFPRSNCKITLSEYLEKQKLLKEEKFDDFIHRYSFEDKILSHKMETGDGNANAPPLIKSKRISQSLKKRTSGMVYKPYDGRILESRDDYCLRQSLPDGWSHVQLSRLQLLVRDNQTERKDASHSCLLNENKKDINRPVERNEDSKNTMWYTCNKERKALFAAIESSNGLAIKEIIQSNIDLVNCQDPIYGMTPLMYAVQRRDRPIVKLILQFNPDMDTILDKQGRTAYDIARNLSMNKLYGKDIEYLLLLKAQSYQDVVDYLVHIVGVSSQVAFLFYKERIDFTLFPAITLDDLENLGVPTYEERLQIHRALQFPYSNNAPHFFLKERMQYVPSVEKLFQVQSNKQKEIYHKTAQEVRDQQSALEQVDYAIQLGKSYEQSIRVHHEEEQRRKLEEEENLKKAIQISLEEKQRHLVIQRLAADEKRRQQCDTFQSSHSCNQTLPIANIVHL